MSAQPMNHSTLCLASLATFVSLGCGGSPDPKTAEAPVASADAPAHVETSAAPAASSSAPQATTPKPKDGAPDAGFKPGFNGEDPGKTIKIAGPKAWALTDQGIGLFDVDKAVGTKISFKGWGGEGFFQIPSAFTHDLVKGAKLKKGDAVLHAVVAMVVCSRVTDVTAEHVTVSFEWAGKVDKSDVAADELIPLDGKAGFGAPMIHVAPDSDFPEFGMLVYDDGKTAWLDGDRKFPSKEARAIEVTPLKEGTEVWANSARGKIKKVEPGGVRYEIAFEGDPKTELVDYCHVAKAPKAAKKAD